MNAEITKKTCRMCCTEIPSKARKCPQCHHFQNRLTMVIFHPAIIVLFAVIPLAGYLIVFSMIFDRGEDFQSYKDQIQITDSAVSFGDTRSNATVAVMGMITNTSPVPWKEIQFHVDFFDAEGKRIDVGQREEYSFYLPTQTETSFKISFRREFSEINYVNHSVQILTAKDARAIW